MDGQQRPKWARLLSIWALATSVNANLFLLSGLYSVSKSNDFLNIATALGITERDYSYLTSLFVTIPQALVMLSIGPRLNRFKAKWHLLLLSGVIQFVGLCFFATANNKVLIAVAQILLYMGNGVNQPVNAVLVTEMFPAITSAMPFAVLNTAVWIGYGLQTPFYVSATAAGWRFTCWLAVCLLVICFLAMLVTFRWTEIKSPTTEHSLDTFDGAYARLPSIESMDESEDRTVSSSRLYSAPSMAWIVDASKETPRLKRSSLHVLIRQSRNSRMDTGRMDTGVASVAPAGTPTMDIGILTVLGIICSSPTLVLLLLASAFRFAGGYVIEQYLLQYMTVSFPGKISFYTEIEPVNIVVGSTFSNILTGQLIKTLAPGLTTTIWSCFVGGAAAIVALTSHEFYVTLVALFGIFFLGSGWSTGVLVTIAEVLPDGILLDCVVTWFFALSSVFGSIGVVIVGNVMGDNVKAASFRTPLVLVTSFGYVGGGVLMGFAWIVPTRLPSTLSEISEPPSRDTESHRNTALGESQRNTVLREDLTLSETELGK